MKPVADAQQVTVILGHFHFSSAPNRNTLITAALLSKVVVLSTY